jgi:hypothetical protein
MLTVAIRVLRCRTPRSRPSVRLCTSMASTTVRSAVVPHAQGRKHAVTLSSLTHVLSLALSLSHVCADISTLSDALNFAQLAQPSALYLFDDQCDPKMCGAHTIYQLPPTLATCDLAEARFMRLVDAAYGSGPRQWGLYRLNRERPSPAPPALLPCVALCRVRFNESVRTAVATRMWWHQPGIPARTVHEGRASYSVADLNVQWQQSVRPREGCRYSSLKRTA